MTGRDLSREAHSSRTSFAYGKTRIKRYTIAATFALLAVLVIRIVYGPETPTWFRVLPLVMMLAILISDLLRPWRVSIAGDRLVLSGPFTRVNCPLSATEVVVANLPGHQPPWQQITLKCNGKRYKISADIEGFLELGAKLGIDPALLKPHVDSEEYRESCRRSGSGRARRSGQE